MTFSIFLDVLRWAVLVFVLLSIVLWRYLNRYHKVNHKLILNAEYKHDEMDSYTYFRPVRSDSASRIETGSTTKDPDAAASKPPAA